MRGPFGDARGVLPGGRPAGEPLGGEDLRRLPPAGEQVAPLLGGLMVAGQPGVDGVGVLGTGKMRRLERPLVVLGGPGVAPCLVAVEGRVGATQRVGNVPGLLDGVRDAWAVTGCLKWPASPTSAQPGPHARRKKPRNIGSAPPRPWRSSPPGRAAAG